MLLSSTRAMETSYLQHPRLTLLLQRDGAEACSMSSADVYPAFLCGCSTGSVFGGAHFGSSATHILLLPSLQRIIRLSVRDPIQAASRRMEHATTVRRFLSNNCLKPGWRYPRPYFCYVLFGILPGACLTGLTGYSPAATPGVHSQNQFSLLRFYREHHRLLFHYSSPDTLIDYGSTYACNSPPVLPLTLSHPVTTHLNYDIGRSGSIHHH